MKERDIQAMIRVALSEKGAVTFRNTVGLLYTEDGRPVKVGLAVGSSDLIGWKTVIITPDMVGKCLAVFLAVEVKTSTGRLDPNQHTFLKAVSKAGGIAGVARNEQEAISLLDGGLL